MDFINFGLKDFIDILLVALVLFYTYKLMKESGSINIFSGILIFVLIWLVVTQILEMRLLGTILDKLVSVGVLALIVLFQDEIRRFLLTLGAHRQFSAIIKFFTNNKKKEKKGNEDIMPIVMACISMGKQKTGALIVVEHNLPLDDIIRTGEVIDADINQRLIENIFFKNSPLHDGAMIIRKNRIRAAGCILPVSHDLNIPKELGLRHRAAMGISQESDAHAIIVSEETGSISIAYRGQFYLRLSAEELESLLTTS
ncbi:diadenylate cyclase CdaA [Bacteroides sp. 519]|uniref:diadenylate cyclase CdaA n=1 Tax=Bacteroides sp. 519 TaxID=2302937 RepID=UPI0013D3D428|nr:diadenylate cyclase CdaA [Bacteroides sp. 519]NDV57264.1 TIGR00159 family protein [Bacteroides sp. 519]